MKWRYRNLTKHNLFGLYLLLKMCQKNKKGVYLTNSCLRQVLKVERVHKTNLDNFAKEISHLFAHKQNNLKDINNHRVLMLGVSPEQQLSESECEMFYKYPSNSEMEKTLRIELIEWITNDPTPYRAD